MLFPGPAMATATAVPAARLGGRIGFRIPGVLGAALLVAGCLWWITQTGDTPAYFYEYLPGSLIGGAGVGMVIPTLTGAGASSLAPERFATGAAVLTMGRQIGVALGVALLVAVLGPAATQAADFHTAWLICTAGGLATGFTVAWIRTPVRVPAAAAPAGAELGETPFAGIVGDEALAVGSPAVGDTSRDARRAA